MQIIFIFLIILILYARTYNYYNLIDDHVPRHGYMYTITSGKIDDLSFYDKKRSFMYTFTSIGVFMGVCGYIYYFWGFYPALLYAVMPLNVCGVAWATGSYYMSTVLLVLSTHYFLSFGDLSGALVAMFMYSASLNSTVSAFSYLPIALCHPFGWLLIFPTLKFLLDPRGRWQKGMAQRKKRHENIKVKSIDIKNILNIPKTLAYYVYLSTGYPPLGMFHSLGKTKRFYSKMFLFESIAVLSVFLYAGYILAPSMTMWWLLSLGLFSQFVIFGMFTAERYTFIANIGFCVLLSAVISVHPALFAVVCTLWFCKSLEYIPAWRHNETLFSYSVNSFPKCPENYNNLASLYIDRKDYVNAIGPLLTAFKVAEGRKYGILCNLAHCYASTYNFGEAYKYTEMALMQAPEDKVKALKKQKHEIGQRIIKMKQQEKALRKRGIL